MQVLAQLWHLLQESMLQCLYGTEGSSIIYISQHCHKFTKKYFSANRPKSHISKHQEPTCVSSQGNLCLSVWHYGMQFIICRATSLDPHTLLCALDDA